MQSLSESAILASAEIFQSPTLPECFESGVQILQLSVLIEPFDARVRFGAAAFIAFRLSRKNTKFPNWTDVTVLHKNRQHWFRPDITPGLTH